MDVKILDFRQLKEINRLFKDVIEHILAHRH